MTRSPLALICCVALPVLVVLAYVRWIPRSTASWQQLMWGEGIIRNLIITSTSQPIPSLYHSLPERECPQRGVCASARSSRSECEMHTITRGIHRYVEAWRESECAQQGR